MRSIQDIIYDWKHECGIQRTGKSGSYRMIPFEGKKDLLLALAQTMIDEGHSEESILSLNTRNLVCNTCAAPDAANVKNNKKIKQITGEQWKEALKEFYRGPVSQFRPKETKNYSVPVEEVEESSNAVLSEINPSDRIKVDTTGFAETPLDLDFLSEIGQVPEQLEEQK